MHVTTNTSERNVQVKNVVSVKDVTKINNLTNKVTLQQSSSVFLDFILIKTIMFLKGLYFTRKLT